VRSGKFRAGRYIGLSIGTFALERTSEVVPTVYLSMSRKFSRFCRASMLLLSALIFPR